MFKTLINWATLWLCGVKLTHTKNSRLCFNVIWHFTRSDIQVLGCFLVLFFAAFHCFNQINLFIVLCTACILLTLIMINLSHCVFWLVFQQKPLLFFVWMNLTLPKSAGVLSTIFAHLLKTLSFITSCKSSDRIKTIFSMPTWKAQGEQAWIKSE